MSISIILIHIIRKKKNKILAYPHKSIIVVKLSIGFYTVQFLEKFAIDREISKEFFAIDRFIYCTLLFITGHFLSSEFYDRSQKIPLKFCDRSLYLLNIIGHFLYNEFYDRSQKIPLKFCDRSQFFPEIVQRINRSIAKIQRNFLQLIANFSRNCTVEKPIDRKKFL